MTQRGNRRLWTFFSDEDREARSGLMREWRDRCGVGIRAHCY
jgi:putative transposase